MLMKPSPFDNRFIAGDDNMSEGGKNEIHTEPAGHPHESYLSSYVTALDLCLQGLISPFHSGNRREEAGQCGSAAREREGNALYQECHCGSSSGDAAGVGERFDQCL